MLAFQSRVRLNLQGVRVFERHSVGAASLTRDRRRQAPYRDRNNPAVEVMAARKQVEDEAVDDGQTLDQVWGCR